MIDMSKDSFPKPFLLQIDDHKEVKFLCGCLLKFYTFYSSNTAIPIQASLQEFQHAPTNWKTQVFLIIQANSTTPIHEEEG